MVFVETESYCVSHPLRSNLFMLCTVRGVIEIIVVKGTSLTLLPIEIQASQLVCSGTTSVTAKDTDENCSTFTSIDIINCHVFSSVHHYIDSTGEWSPPLQLSFKPEFLSLLGFLPCWTYSQLPLPTPLQFHLPSLSGCQGRWESTTGPLMLGPVMRL